jgi:hypothetical protein
MLSVGERRCQRAAADHAGAGEVQGVGFAAVRGSNRERDAGLGSAEGVAYVLIGEAKSAGRKGNGRANLMTAIPEEVRVPTIAPTINFVYAKTREKRGFSIPPRGVEPLFSG